MKNQRLSRYVEKTIPIIKHLNDNMNILQEYKQNFFKKTFGAFLEKYRFLRWFLCMIATAKDLTKLGIALVIIDP